jgi:hypothetical protein
VVHATLGSLRPSASSSGSFTSATVILPFSSRALALVCEEVHVHTCIPSRVTGIALWFGLQTCT